VHEQPILVEDSLHGSQIMVLDVDIARDVDAPSEARRAVRSLRGQLDADVLADATLLVSELVTNSVKYGEGSILMRLRTRGARQVTAEVLDEGAGFDPHERRPSRSAPGGFGLRLVDEIASRWGIRDDSARVWFEIDRSADLVAAA
jgi:two-component sensor histidine kinase